MERPDYTKKIPELTMSALERYQRGIPTGDFLRAVLSNNLVDAYARADAGNQLAMREIVLYVYNEMPTVSWGSAAVVDAWLGLHAWLAEHDEDPKYWTTEETKSHKEMTAQLSTERNRSTQWRLGVSSWG